jgi:lipoprotein-releasing system permease protein
MSFATEINIALRYLKSKKKDGFASVVSIFSFLGIMLGVATLIVTMAVMNGVKTELINRIIGINAHISINSYSGKIGNYDSLTGELESIDGVVRVTPAIYTQVLASIRDENIGLMLRGIESSRISKKPYLESAITFGQLYNDDNFTLIAGSILSKKLGLSPYSKLSLISPRFNTTLLGNIPRMKDFTISGVFDIGMYEYDSSILFSSLTSVQKFLNMKGVVNTIEIEVKDPKKLDAIKSDVINIVGQDMYITDWQKANEGFIESINVQSNVLFLILALIILVAAFNVISGMVMLVNNKSKEVAILRTIGLNRFSIIRIFVICGSLIGILGTLLGLALGLSFAANIEEIRLWLESVSGANLFAAEIYFLSKLPAEVRYQDVINITSLSIFLSIAASLYPAFKAASIEPAKALKYE